jgi:6-pyruvoyl-tetrahydropterin synthase
MNTTLPYELSVSTYFDAAHRLLHEHYRTGTRLHGHTYQVVVRMRGDRLYVHDMVFDHYAVRNIIH